MSSCHSSCYERLTNDRRTNMPPCRLMTVVISIVDYDGHRAGISPLANQSSAALRPISGIDGFLTCVYLPYAKYNSDLI